MSTAEPLVLVIEDDPQTRRVLGVGLTGSGWTMIEAASGSVGLTMARTYAPDMMILDLGLPDIDGVSLVHRLRETRGIGVPILILSARAQEDDKVMALDAGADDYLTKPFSTVELGARLRAFLRRSRRDPLPQVFESASLRIDMGQRRVFKDRNEVRLTPIEFRLLDLLVRHAGFVVTHRQLLNEIWGPEHLNDSHYLRIYMGQLRRKLESDPARPRNLLTEMGVGYRLMSDHIDSEVARQNR